VVHWGCFIRPHVRIAVQDLGFLVHATVNHTPLSQQRGFFEIEISEPEAKVTIPIHSKTCQSRLDVV